MRSRSSTGGLTQGQCISSAAAKTARARSRSAERSTEIGSRSRGTYTNLSRFDRILNSEREPQNWLTYSGSLQGGRHRSLKALTPENVSQLDLAWLWTSQSTGRFEATPLVIDGVLYTVQAPNDVVALDAISGEVLWTFKYTPAAAARATGGGGRPNRGLATLGDRLFLGTLDAHLLAIDARTGKLVWDTTVANYFYALDARTGVQLWRTSLAASVHGSPISFVAGGTQYVAVSAGNSLFAFALRRP